MRWRKGGMISCLTTRRRKRSRKRYKASRTKEEICRRTVSLQKRRCGSSKRSSGKEERILFLSNKVDKNKMADAEMAAELQSMQAGEERRGSNASQAGDGCLEALWQQLIALGANGIEAFVQRLQREMGAAQGQMPRVEGRRNSEDEQEQGRIQGAPANSLELDIHRVRGVPGGDGGSTGRSGTQGDRKRGPSKSPGRHTMDEEWDDDVGEVVPSTQKKEKKTARDKTPKH